VQELTGTTPKASLITGGIDELFLRRETAATRHPMTDALGSVIALTDAAGAMATEYTFEPYGNPTTSGTTDTNTQSYTGRENDGAGLHYYRARYYSSLHSRFLTEDPLEYSAGPNFYQYVDGNPIDGLDPLGLANGGGRGITGGSSGRGTANKYKHCKNHPSDPKKIICVDKGTGKKIEKPKPADWPKDAKFECDTGCQAIGAGIIVGCVVTCAIAPHLCGFVVLGGAAAAY
jgi:RHS repeat-associated protein